MRDSTAARRGRREPLWDRIDRNRVKVGVFLTLFVVAAAVSAALMVGAGGVFVGFALLRGGEGDFFAALPYVTLGALALGGALAGVHISRTLTRPEERLPGRFGAVPVQTGDLPDTERVLHDMALAAGFRVQPRVWLIDDCERINAFAIGMDETRTVIGVTRGLVQRLSPEDQRAVFANLMARAQAGDTRWATVLSAVMGPIWEQRASQLSQDKRLHTTPTWESVLDGGAGGVVAYARPQDALGIFILGFLGVLLTELLMAGHERAAMAAAEKADAEGMLLLKDPEQMLATLSKVLEANNTVPGAMESYSALFYCWAGAGYAPEDDPEMRRLGRLREVIGVAGAGDAGSVAL